MKKDNSNLRYMLFGVVSILILVMFSSAVYSWTCPPVKFYYDKNRNGVLDSTDPEITQKIKDLIAGGTQYIPIYTFITVNGEDCTKTTTYHCQNTARSSGTAYGDDYLTIYKGGKVTPKVSEETVYVAHITSDKKDNLLNIYENHLYTDISFRYPYRGNLNPFNYVDSSIIPTLDGIFSTNDFEDIIINKIIDNILQYVNSTTPSTGENSLRCYAKHPSSSYAEIVCFRKILISHTREVYDPSTNTTKTEVYYTTEIQQDSMYLSYEKVFWDILSTYNLADITTEEYVTFEFVGGEPQKVAENVKQFYITEPGVVYSFYHTPSLKMTCHGSPGHIWCPEG